MTPLSKRWWCILSLSVFLKHLWLILVIMNWNLSYLVLGSVRNLHYTHRNRPALHFTFIGFCCLCSHLLTQVSMVSPVTTLTVFGTVEDTKTATTPLKVGGVFTESTGSATSIHCHHIAPVSTDRHSINDFCFLSHCFGLFLSLKLQSNHQCIDRHWAHTDKSAAIIHQWLKPWE